MRWSEQVETHLLIPPGDRQSGTSLSVSTIGAEEVLFLLVNGYATPEDGTIALTIEESADGVAWSAVSGAVGSAALGAAGTVAISVRCGTGRARLVRAALLVTLVDPDPQVPVPCYIFALRRPTRTPAENTPAVVQV